MQSKNDLGASVLATEPKAMIEIHDRLGKLAGEWDGATKTWFEPGILADESVTRGSFKPVLDGRFMLYEYEGSLEKQPMKGIALCGYHVSLKRFQMAWVDNLHNDTAIMFLQGETTPADLKKAFAAVGSYGGGAEIWRNRNDW